MVETLVTYVTVGARGRPVRTGTRISGTLLTIGRASRCQIHLLDPRIALEHAQIAVSETGAVISAPPGRIRVNGKDADSAQLAAGDRIEIGPFVIEVAPSTDVALTLAVTQVASSSPLEDPLRRIIRRTRPFPRRRLSYALILAVLLGCLGLQIAFDRLASFDELDHPGVNTVASRTTALLDTDAVARNVLRAWSPGPLRQSHQVFGANCRACHQEPFVQVQDRSCLECHGNLPEHTPRANLSGPRGHEFKELRCAHCHRDHKGRDAVVHAQDMCAGCHRDIRQWSAAAESRNVGDFAREHPPFRLQLPDPAQEGRLLRVRQEAGKALAESSNLKFSHKAHLDPAGLRTPQGRKRLVCADCHQPNDDGMLMSPVSMKKHCESCHALTFDPAASRRTLPHAPVEQVAATLRDFYARQALGEPLPLDAAAGTGAARPGSFVLNYQERQNVLAAANRRARSVLDELFGKRAVCSQCHEVARSETEPHWSVAPIRMNSQWMPRARFTHAGHATMKCGACHDIAGSARSSDVAMPTIGKCRECHVGARAVLGKVTSDCGACHRFHAGEHYWQDGAARGKAAARKER
jgi:hypothetical protein